MDGWTGGCGKFVMCHKIPLSDWIFRGNRVHLILIIQRLGCEKTCAVLLVLFTHSSPYDSFLFPLLFSSFFLLPLLIAPHSFSLSCFSILSFCHQSSPCMSFPFPSSLFYSLVSPLLPPPCFTSSCLVFPFLHWFSFHPLVSLPLLLTPRLVPPLLSLISYASLLSFRLVPHLLSLFSSPLTIIAPLLPLFLLNSLSTSSSHVTFPWFPLYSVAFPVLPSSFFISCF